MNRDVWTIRRWTHRKDSHTEDFIEKDLQEEEEENSVLKLKERNKSDEPDEHQTRLVRLS